MDAADILDCDSLADWLTQSVERWLDRIPGRSLRQLAARLAIPNSTLHDVMRGIRKLPTRWVDPLIAAAELDPFEADVLRAMVEVDQANTTAQRQRALDQLRGKQRILKARRIRASEAVLLVSPNVAAARELRRLPTWRADPAWVADRLGISESEAAWALEALGGLDPNLLDGQVTFSTGHRPVEQVAPDWHRQIMERATAATALPREQRHFESWLAAIPSSRIPRLRERVMAFIEEVSAICEEEDGLARDVIIQVSAQLFPLSRPEDEKIDP